MFRFLPFSLSLLVAFCDVVEYEMRDLEVSVRGRGLGLVYLHQGSAKKCVSQHKAGTLSSSSRYSDGGSSKQG